MSQKTLIVFVSLLTVGLFFSLFPTKVQAITTEQIRAQIAELQAQIAELQRQLIQIEQPTTWCHNFNVNLKVEDRGSEVIALHQALEKEGFGPFERGGDDESVFNLFTEQTASAVVEFQEKYASEILTPLGLRRGTGYVGKSTRAKLNKIYGCAIVPPPPASCLKEGEKGIPTAALGRDCCAGLTSITSIDSFVDSNCTLNPLAHRYGYVCTYCGNGVCGKGENACNCARDCKKTQAPVISYISPSYGYQDTDILTMTIKGFNFTGASDFSGCGISPVLDRGFQLLSCRLVSDAEVEAQFSISQTATAGSRDITIQTPKGGKSNTVIFNVVAATKQCISEGQTGFDFNKDSCCEGLTKVNLSLTCQSNRILPVEGFTCVKCGNGICGKGENVCNCPQDCKPSSACTDSDGGKNYYTKGECASGNLGAYDYCSFLYTSRAGVLKETYCDSNNLCAREDYFCPAGKVCRAGKCVDGKPDDPICTDTDNGANENVKGEVHSVDLVEAEDSCYVSRYPDRADGALTASCLAGQSSEYCGVYEYFCSNSDYSSHQFIRCPYGCKNGACIGAVQPVGLTMLSPNGGEQWQIGNNYLVQWKASGVNKVNIELENWGAAGAGGPLTWLLGSNIDALVPGSTDGGEFLVGISASILPKINPGSQYKIRVVDAADTSAYSQQLADVSDNYFSIAAAVESVLSCNDLEDSQKSYFDICKASGFENTCFNKYSGAFQGCIRNTRDDCTVYNTNADKNILCSVGLTPSVNVISPNGGEQWRAGNSYIIQWLSKGIDRIDIRVANYSIAKAGASVTIATNLLASNGSYTWEIPGNFFTYNAFGNFGDNLKVIVVERKAGTAVEEIFGIKDESDNYFSISQAVTPTSTCTDSDGGRDYYNKGIATYFGQQSPDICTANTGLLNEAYCTTPTSYTASGATYEQYQCPYGCQDGACKKGVGVVYPNGGEKLTVGQNYTLKWEEATQNVRFFKVYLIDKDGRIFEDLGIGLVDANRISTTVSLEWNIPSSIPAGSYKLRVYGCLDGATCNNKVSDDSDNYFSITSAITQKAPPCENYGDVNSDGYVTKADSDLILQYGVGQIQFSTEQIKRGDVSGNGTVSSYDSALVLQYMENIITTFPVCTIARGTLAISLDAATPPAGLMVAGSINKEFTRVKLTTDQAETLNISKITVAVSAGEGMPIGGCQNVSLWDGATKVGLTQAVVPSSGIIVFNLATPWQIPAGSNKYLSIKADVNSSAVSGGTIHFDILSGSVSFSGATSALTGTNSGSAIGNIMKVYGTLPSISYVGPVNNALVNGTSQTLLKFKVRADAGGDVSIYSFNFGVVLSDVNSITNLYVSNFALYNEADLSKKLNDTLGISTDKNTYEMPCITCAIGYPSANASETGDVKAQNLNGALMDVITAGAEKTYVLKADIAGAAAYDSVITRLADLNATAKNAIVWGDGQQINIGSEGIKTIPTNYGSLTALSAPSGSFSHIDVLIDLTEQLASIADYVSQIDNQLKKLFGR